MPAEQTGLVRENYLWKVLLRRGQTKEEQFKLSGGTYFYDQKLFELIWGPTLTALRNIIDKTSDVNLYKKLLLGFYKSASISSFYHLTENFDGILLTLCKFTTITTIPIDSTNDVTIKIQFGGNVKIQLALKMIFSIVHEYGDCLRNSWKTIIAIIVQLLRLQIIPKSLMEVDDFTETNGKFVLQYDHKKSPQNKDKDSSLLSSIYSYLSSDSQKMPSYEEQELIKVIKVCVKECHIEQILNESKFYEYDSLENLINYLLAVLKSPNDKELMELNLSEDIVVFLLELLIKILIQNRDRIQNIWKKCRDQLFVLLVTSALHNYDYLLIRTTIGILKLGIYLMRNDELCPIVLESLNMFLLLKPAIILKISKHISTGIYELLKTSAQNIHTEADWSIIFTLLEYVGAGSIPNFTRISNYGELIEIITETQKLNVEADTDEVHQIQKEKIEDVLVLNHEKSISGGDEQSSPTAGNWILINKESDKITQRSTSPVINSLIYECQLIGHSPNALVKCWDCLAFIVRNVAHITPYNFENCVKCIRIFVEASLNNEKFIRTYEEGREIELPERYQTISIQLLDLMHTLHTRTAQIFRWWAEEGGNVIPKCSALWEQGWCPILQGISRLATDKRRQVRTSAITCLQRSLLVHDLQTLTGPEWSSCFYNVLFPLLNELLTEATPAVSYQDQQLIEESRMRAATIMSKVFLHHLTPLISLRNFNELWLEILDYLEQFMKIGSDMLYEAVLESLKNMLLVMHSVSIFGFLFCKMWTLNIFRFQVRVFHNSDGYTRSELWNLTWKRIGEFLPNLKDELFRGDDLEVIEKVTTIESTISTIKSDVPPTEEEPFNMLDLQPGLNHSSIILQPPGYQSQSPVLCSPTQPQTPILTPSSTDISLPVPTSTVHPIPMFDVTNPPIPISHLISGNQYPSLNRVPINIAQSFSPIFVQPQNNIVDGGDIYNDYVKNPYNMTLHDSQTTSMPIENSTPVALQPQQQENVFQSVNYFGSGNNSNTDTGNIPPGSEVLFGGPS